MLNDVTVGHPTTRQDVIDTLSEINDLYTFGNDEQALHLLDVLMTGVETHLQVELDEARCIVHDLGQIAQWIEMSDTDVEDYIRELVTSLRAA